MYVKCSDEYTISSVGTTAQWQEAVADVLEGFLECLSDIFVLKGFLFNLDLFHEFLVFSSAYLFLEQGTVHHSTGKLIYPDVRKNL